MSEQPTKAKLEERRVAGTHSLFGQEQKQVKGGWRNDDDVDSLDSHLLASKPDTSTDLTAFLLDQSTTLEEKILILKARATAEQVTMQEHKPSAPNEKTKTEK